MSMIWVSIGQSMMALNPSVTFSRATVRSAGLVVNMVVRSRGLKLNFYIEDHCDLGGNIISRLDNGDFAYLIYSLLALTD